MKQQQYYGGGGANNRGGNIAGGKVKNYAPVQNVGRTHGRSNDPEVGSFNEQPSYQYGEEPYSSHGSEALFSGEQIGTQHLDDATRSDTLTNIEIVANLYASPKSPPLRELLGHVRRLSRDQVGCLLLQQALDEEGDIAATEILTEGLSFWDEAMVDPFGNYLFQKILEKIIPVERVILINTASPRLVNASLNLHGTLSAQKVVELCAMTSNESCCFLSLLLLSVRFRSCCYQCWRCCPPPPWMLRDPMS